MTVVYIEKIIEFRLLQDTASIQFIAQNRVFVAQNAAFELLRIYNLVYS